MVGSLPFPQFLTKLERFVRDKRSSLFGLFINNEKKIITLTIGGMLCNKLVRFHTPRHQSDVC